MALTILAGGCSEGEQERSSPPAAAHSTMPKDCDMAGMDMSKMSAEEHQKMLEDCETEKAGGRVP